MDIYTFDDSHLLKVCMSFLCLSISSAFFLKKYFMERIEIVNDIMAGLTEELADLNVENIRLVKNYKNNGVRLTGLSIKLVGKSIAPCIYIDNYIDSILKEGSKMDIYDIIDPIAKSIRKACKRLDDNDLFSIDEASAKENIILRMINYEKNKELLKDAIYYKFNDLAVTLRWEVNIAGEEGDFLVTKKMGAPWNLKQKELFNIARENTFKKYKPVIRRLNDVLSDLMLGTSEGSLCDDNPALYISNCGGAFGAVAMLNSETLEEVAKIFDSDYYIIPSSVNEIIAVPVFAVDDTEQVKWLIKRVNQETVSKTDFLSDSLYFYHSLEKSVFMV